MDAPGTRYKVVERGRRLEVIDTWNGNVAVKPMREDIAPTGPPHNAPSPIEAVRASTLDQRGQRILSTKPWYDAKGPRQIVVTQQGAEKLKGLRIVAFVAVFIAAVFAFLFWPFLLVLPFILMNNETRKSLRAAATKFLDTINQPVTGSSAG